MNKQKIAKELIAIAKILANGEYTHLMQVVTSNEKKDNKECTCYAIKLAWIDKMPNDKITPNNLVAKEKWLVEDRNEDVKKIETCCQEQKDNCLSCSFNVLDEPYIRVDGNYLELYTQVEGSISVVKGSVFDPVDFMRKLGFVSVPSL